MDMKLSLMFWTSLIAISLFADLFNASLSADIYRQGFAADVANNVTIWFGGPSYMHDLFYQLTIAYPRKSDSRWLQWVDGKVVYEADRSRSMDPVVCRLADYLNECFHDYEGLNNVIGTSDNSRPFFNDFALTDFITNDTNLAKYSDLKYIPAVGVCIVPIHSVNGFDANNGDPLVLSRTTLARIFRRNITSWSHSEILATNPKHVSDLIAAGNITLVVREEGSQITQTFKRALGGFEADFKTQIGGTGDPTWNGISLDKITFREGEIGTASFFQLKKNAIGYLTLSEALKNDIEYAAILPSTYTSLADAVFPNSTSNEFTLSDKGLEYGTGATNSSKLTISLLGSTNKYAWPILSYMYFAFRANTLRPGADCSTRRDVFDFITWFYGDNASSNTIRKFGFTPIPAHIRSVLLPKFQKFFMCNNQLVYDPYYEKSVVKIFGLEELYSSYNVLQESYLRIKEDVYLDFEADIEDHILQKVDIKEVSQTAPYIGFAKKSDWLLMQDISSNSNLQRYPYAGISVGIIYNLCGAVARKNCTAGNIELKLDLETIGGIFDGGITYWDDLRISNHNQGISIPHLPIYVVKPEQSDYRTLLDQVIKTIDATFTFRANSISVASEDDVMSKVLETTGSISFLSLFGSFNVLSKRALIKNKYGNYVSPLPDNIKACAKDTFNITTGLFDLVSSSDPDCYPLSEEIYLVSPKEYPTCSSSAQTNVAFLQWILNGYGIKTHGYDTVHYPNLILSDGNTIVNTEVGLINNNIAPLFSASVNPVDSKYRKDGTSAMLYVVNKLESIKCAGQQMLMKHADLRLIPDYIITAVYTVASLALFIIVSLALWTFINRKKKLIRNSSPVFMYQILFGAAVSILAIYPMGIQDSFYSFHDPEANKQTQHLDMACQAMPFLYSVGFAISFSSLFVKTWRMVKLFNNRRFKKLRITDWMLVKYQIALVLFIIIFNVVWIALDPLKWKRIGLTMSDSGQYIISTGICAMNTNVYYALGPLMGFMILLLAIGNYMSYQARNIPSEFSESKWIGFSMLLYLEALVLGVPVIILSTDNASSSFIVKSVAILLADFGTVLLIFIPKIWLLYGWGIDDQDSLNRERTGTESYSKTILRKQNGSKHSREQLSSGRYAQTFVANPILDAEVKHGNANVNSQGSLTDTNGIPYGVSMKATSSALDVRIKPPKPKATDADIPVEINSKVYPSISEALEDELVRQSLIVYAAPQLFDEPVRFYSDVIDFKTTKNPQTRSKKATNIIKRYILADSPLELCLPAPLRHKYERMLAIHDQENGNEKETKSRGFFGIFKSASSQASSAVATIVQFESEAKTKDPCDAISTTIEQLSDVDIFQPVLRLVALGIQGDKRRWKGAITFLDHPAATMKKIESKDEVVSESSQLEPEPSVDAFSL